jgi:hypothetical protein
LAALRVHIRFLQLLPAGHATHSPRRFDKHVLKSLTTIPGSRVRHRGSRRGEQRGLGLGPSQTSAVRPSQGSTPHGSTREDDRIRFRHVEVVRGLVQVSQIRCLLEVSQIGCVGKVEWKWRTCRRHSFRCTVKHGHSAHVDE